jgi:hypothetical protein
MSMFSFDRKNRTLNFFTDFFFEECERANLAIFEVEVGDRVYPGARIGELVFNGGKRVPMFCPPGVAGEVAAVNRRIDYGLLHEPPVQFAVRLVWVPPPPPLDPNPFD